MLNIKPLAPGGEAYYLETVASGVEDYYLGAGEAPGYWLGGATGTFGLHGQVDDRNLRAVLAGTDPRTGEQLTGHGRGRKRTVPGYDATFNAPKSVSLLWALGDADTSRHVRRAHDRAVAEALGYLERNAAYVRRRGQKVRADGVVAAAFRQRTSRAGDPHLHTHVLIANHGRTSDDGQWRALDGALLLSHTRTAGFVYQAILRHELTRLLGIAWNPVTNGYADVAGMPRWLLDAFSTRRAEIIKLLDALGLSSARAAQKAAYATRRAKTPAAGPPAPPGSGLDYEGDTRALQERWRDLAAEAGWTDEQLRALLAVAQHQPLTAEQAMWVAGDLCSPTGLTEHASTFNRRDAIRGWAERLPQGAASARQLEDLADALLADDTTATVRLTRDALADDDRPEVDAVVDALAAGLDADDAAAVRSSAALAEGVGAALTAGAEPDVLIAALLARELDSAEDPASVLVYRARQLTPDLPRDDPHRAGQPTMRLGDGTQVPVNPGELRYSTPELLAVEQKLVDHAVTRRGANVGLAPADAVEAAIAGRAAAGRPLSAEQERMVRRITGSGAGVEVVVGKAGTGKTSTLAAARAAWEAGGQRVIGTALAARAAQELSAGAGIASWTVAKLLQLGDGPRPVFSPGTVLVVDEAAMVGTRQLARLLDLAGQADAKVVLVGDHHQLPEIDAGGAFRGLLTRLDAVELTVNRRQRQEWERHALDALRVGEVNEAIGAWDRAGRIVVGDDPAATLGQMVADWWDAPGRGTDPSEHGIMLTLRRADVEALNAAARRLMSAAGNLGDDTVPGAHGREFAVGDSAVCVQNSATLHVVNGLRGRVTAVDPATGGLTLRLPDDQERRIPPSYLREGHLIHGYALTGHRAQGLTTPQAWVLGGDLLYREWAYTALSRHQDAVRLYLTGEETIPDWVEHPAALAADPHSPLDKLSQAAGRSRAQTLGLDHLARELPTDQDSDQNALRTRLTRATAATHDDNDSEKDEPVVEQLAARLAAVEADPPSYLTRVLGPRPKPERDHGDQVDAWRAGAAAVEDYRHRWDVDDPARALGVVPIDPAQRADRDSAAAALRTAQHTLGVTPPRAQLALEL
jgi:conjugative relaxase-like TrwC/TraI family protein